MNRDDLGGGSDASPSLTLQMGEAIVVRLAQLERDLKAARRTIALLSAGLVAATALAVIAFGSSVLLRGRADAVETQQLVLHDAQGISRAVMRVADDGTASLVLQDRNATARLRLSVLDNGAPGISLLDNRGRSRAVLAFLPEQGGTLVFADEQGNTRAVLGLSGPQGASLAFLDATGATRANIGIDEDGEPTFGIADRPGGSASADTSGGN